jgi:hypothetical protein
MASLARFNGKLKKQLEAASGFEQLVSEQEINKVCRAVGHRWRNCFWRPTVIILTFLRQVLHGCSCRQAVSWTVVGSAAGDAGIGAAGEGWVSEQPSAYSQARQKLPASVLRELNGHVVKRLDQQTEGQRWCGRSVQVVDGSAASMPDTPELQKAYPQSSQQRKGCGFPIARLVALFDWGSGAMRELLVSSTKVGEQTLSRQFHGLLKAKDVLLGDRLFCTYYDMASLLARGVDTVFRMNAARSTDLRRGKRLGKNDHEIVWRRPKARPKQVTAKQWEAIPETLTVRHVRFEVATQGFRSRQIDLVTTLLDPKAYPLKALAELYRDRWLAELNLRSFKCTLHMDVLRCQSVRMVQKELMVGQLAYNLIRLLMVEAATHHQRDLHAMSFAGAGQRVFATLVFWERATPRQRRRLAKRMLEMIAEDELPNRPNRIEPRCVKRRPKSYPCLFEPRDAARQRAIRTNSKSPNKYAAACRKGR